MDRTRGNRGTNGNAGGNGNANGRVGDSNLPPGQEKKDALDGSKGNGKGQGKGGKSESRGRSGEAHGKGEAKGRDKSNKNKVYDLELSYVNDILAPSPEVLATYDGQGQPRDAFVYGLQRLAGTGPTGQSTAYVYDGLGNVRQLADAQGSVFDRYTYSPYGLPAANGRLNPSHKLNDGNTFGFGGQDHDPALGLIYLRARYYTPALGRFTAPDPLVTAGFELPGMSPYAYGRDNPLSYLDPSGLVAETVQAARTSWAGTIASIGLSIVPGLGDIKDITEALTGVDLITGQKLSAFQRGISVVAMVLPFVGAGAVRAIVSKMGREAAEVGTREVAEVAAKEGEEIIPSVLYHYTSKARAEEIVEKGALGKSNRSLYLTTRGDLSPLQAQIELALPPGNTAEGVIAVSREGLDLTQVIKVGRVTGNVFRKSWWWHGNSVPRYCDQSIPAPMEVMHVEFSEVLAELNLEHQHDKDGGYGLAEAIAKYARHLPGDQKGPFADNLFQMIVQDEMNLADIALLSLKYHPIRQVIDALLGYVATSVSRAERHSQAREIVLTLEQIGVKEVLPISLNFLRSYSPSKWPDMVPIMFGLSAVDDKAFVDQTSEWVSQHLKSGKPGCTIVQQSMQSLLIWLVSRGNAHLLWDVAGRVRSLSTDDGALFATLVLGELSGEWAENHFGKRQVGALMAEAERVRTTGN
ncbi:MAG: RHS repeat-associated core domain-containing protein [Bacillota bacterium]